MSQNESNGLTTAQYFAAKDAVVRNPPREEAGRQATGWPRLLASTALFLIAFSLAAGVGIGCQIGLPLLLKKVSTLCGGVAKPLAGARSPQTALQKMLIKNHADVMAEIQQRNKANPVNPHLEKLTREGFPQQDWNTGKGGFQPAQFGS